MTDINIRNLMTEKIETSKHFKFENFEFSKFLNNQDKVFKFLDNKNKTLTEICIDLNDSLTFIFDCSDIKKTFIMLTDSNNAKAINPKGKALGYYTYLDLTTLTVVKYKPEEITSETGLINIERDSLYMLTCEEEIHNLDNVDTTHVSFIKDRIADLIMYSLYILSEANSI